MSPPKGPAYSIVDLVIFPAVGSSRLFLVSQIRLKAKLLIVLSPSVIISLASLSTLLMSRFSNLYAILEPRSLYNLLPNPIVPPQALLSKSLKALSL